MERQGVLVVSMQLNKIGCIFRETPNADVGIDGQIEYVVDGNASGRLAAAQIKSGVSYLHDKGSHWAFYPEQKHKMYWECFPLPVYLFLHDPDSNLTYYTDARYYLNIPERDRNYSYIPVPKSQRLDTISGEEFMASTGPISSNLLEYPEIIKTMAREHSGNGLFPLTYLDLFCNGLTNLCRHIYFGMSLASELAEIYLGIDESEFGLGVGPDEHKFLHNYTRFLISQNLATINYSDYLIDWFERRIQPEYLTPLTSRGRGLVEYMRQLEAQLLGDYDEISVACERPMRMSFALGSDMFRIFKIRNFGKVLLRPDMEI
ncbi:DUF4365 domain-containing protein [Nostoc sp. FACHB-145]|uniref:DUF4365 domain-containing protein n=1 Tax=Nostoc sp. FACHB-145 TaxID=2692836 RepID=UPI00168570EC|nr:DUF4365 domain-containing protein [Nostoc sp. FACHB-145]MBD2472645.1 DUF4365 domain-containing protein [Nostoc sp. FACHB-145]